MKPNPVEIKISYAVGKGCPNAYISIQGEGS